jgi:hypothetical protein
LRVFIKNEKTHKFATYWITSCIGLHTFAMKCEEEEDGKEVGYDRWDFIDEGLSESSSDSDDNVAATAHRGSSGRLRAGKAQREKLKRRIFRAKERRQNL